MFTVVHLRQGIAISLTTLTFIVMVTVVGQQLPPDHGYHGGWIWGVAWFPALLVLTMSFVIEGQNQSKWIPWLVSMGLSYGVLLIAVVWQGQSIWWLLTQAGLMECAALALGYLIAILWVGMRQRQGFGDWFFPQLFGVSLLVIVLVVVTQALWRSSYIGWQDLPWLALAIGIRAQPIAKALRKALT